MKTHRVSLVLCGLLPIAGCGSVAPTTAPDLASAPLDLSDAPDLLPAPDLTDPPDLSPLPDLALLPDLVILPDLTAPTCSDGAKNGDESDVDCGGSKCGRCGDGKGCATTADCMSGVCASGSCAAPSCNDGVKNGDEVDIDCGGAKCGPCGDGKACVAAMDCASGVCSSGQCVAPACVDGVKNGTETDLDCGGKCAPCGDGKACALSADCTSGVCTGGKCQAAACNDMVKNGDETDVDCGGSKCGKCGDGKACGATADCKSGVCTSGKCAASSCTDTVKNGAETDVDCGGGCPACADGKGCAKPGDCASGVCTGGKCQVPNCMDKVKNDGETDVDCGGSCPTPCGDGLACGKGSDCASQVCSGGTCAVPNCMDKFKNGDETDLDCGGSCPPCGFGGNCSQNKDCSTGACDLQNGCRYPTSCAELLKLSPQAKSSVYTLDPDGPGGAASFSAYCEMTADGGGWTLAMKIDGNQGTFAYDAAYWTNDSTYNVNTPDLDGTEAKLATFSALQVNAVRVGMVDAGTTRWLVMSVQSPSLKALFSGGYTATGMGRDKWKGLMANPSLQPNCNQEGFNSVCGGDTRVRIGIVSNQENDCGSCDSRVGLGSYGSYCGQDPGDSAGNEARCSADNGDRSTRGFGYVMVR